MEEHPINKPCLLQGHWDLGMGQPVELQGGPRAEAQLSRGLCPLPGVMFLSGGCRGGDGKQGTKYRLDELDCWAKVLVTINYLWLVSSIPGETRLLGAVCRWGWFSHLKLGPWMCKMIERHPLKPECVWHFQRAAGALWAPRHCQPRGAHGVSVALVRWHRACPLTTADLDLHRISPAAAAPREKHPREDNGDVKEEKLAVFLEQIPALGSRSRLLCDLLCLLGIALSISTTALSHLPTHICISGMITCLKEKNSKRCGNALVTVTVTIPIYSS